MVGHGTVRPEMDGRRRGSGGVQALLDSSEHKVKGGGCFEGGGRRVTDNVPEKQQVFRGWRQGDCETETEQEKGLKIT